MSFSNCGLKFGEGFSPFFIMKKILILIGFLYSINSFSQSTVLLRGDTIKVYKQGGDAVLKVEGHLMLKDYRQGNSNDSILTWDPVTKKVRMMDMNSLSGGGINIYNSDGYLTDADRYVKGLNDTRGIVFDSVSYFMVTQAGQERIYMNGLVTRLNSPDNSQLIGTENDSSYVIADNNNMVWKTDSTLSRKKISYYGNIHSTFGPYSHVDKTYVDSSVAGAGSNLIFEESVVESNDSVFLEGEKANPFTNNTVYGQNSLGVKGAMPIIEVDLTDPQDGDLLAYKSSLFKNVRRFKEMRFISGQTNYTAVGDSIQIDTSFQDKKLKVYREGELQWEDDTVYGYEHSNDSIIFHPPLFTGEKIIIEVYDTLLWKSIDHVEPAAWTDLTFTTSTGLTNTSQVFTSTGSAGFGHTGLDALKLPAGEDGFIAIQYNASDGINAVFGFNTSNTEQTYVGNYEAALDIASGGDIYRVDGGGSVALTSCTGISTGDWVGINRTGSTLKIIRKSGALSSTLADWTVCYTFSFSSSADLFIVCDLFTPGSAKMYYPQGFNIQ